MQDIIKFIITDLLRNKIILIFTLVLALLTWSVFALESNNAKGIASILTILLLVVPLMSLIFSSIYVYNSSEFIELMVSQPIKRKSIWTALFVGLTFSLIISLCLSIGIPVIIFARNMTGMIVLVSSFVMTAIFVALAMLSSILMKDKARGIGFALMIWLFLAFIYDGLVLFFMFQFSDYPIEKLMVLLASLNPIDMARIHVLLQIDEAALMGYTGAVFKKFFGTSTGMLMSFTIMVIWALIPFRVSLSKFKKKDL